VVTARYEIHWYDENGDHIRTVVRPVNEGPPTSASERAQMRDEWEETVAIAGQYGASLPTSVPIPTHRHPVDRIFFDLDGRLWVQLPAAEADTLLRADVWNRDGTYAFTVEWLRGIRLRPGAIRENGGYGIVYDAFDVPSFVRLRWD
jgi:hypothetical protein